MISGWLTRAQQAQGEFESFVFTWIAFNGWAACVTSFDGDVEWKYALMLSTSLQQRFDEVVANEQSELSRAAREFHSMWPIFKAQEIRRAGTARGRSRERRVIVQHYLGIGLRKFEPACWVRHRDEGSPVPLDWPHTLCVLYRVRCNLFHGEKSVHSEMDVAANKVLSKFLVAIGLSGDHRGYMR
jgi:hypothetical protein